MIKKALAVPGTDIKFDRSPMISVNPMGSSVVEVVVGYGEPGSFFDGSVLHLLSGDVATIIEGPKKKDGINAILLEKDGKQGYVYWTEVYYNASII